MIGCGQRLGTSMLAIAAMLSACGGGSGGGQPAAVAPPPPPPVAAPPPPLPAPAPVPVPITSAALLPPTLGPAPTPAFAEPSGPSFASPQSGAAVPLLLSAFGAGFGGDDETTVQGGSVAVDSAGTKRFSLNNPAAGVSQLALAPSPQFQPIAGRGLYGGLFLGFRTQSASSHAVRFSWLIGDINDDYGGGAAIGGLLTRPDRIPASGSATYNGGIGGQLSQPLMLGLTASLDGSVNLSIDHATRTISGRISAIRVGFDGYGSTSPVNTFSFAATFNPATGRYEGEIISGPSPGGLNAFAEGTRGTIILQAFGPDANDIGGLFVISDTTVRAIVSILASR